MPDHEEQHRLKYGLLTMGNLPSAPADPMPAISRRINRRRKVRYTVSGIALAACATLVATTVVPALGGGTSTVSPAASPPATPEPTRSRPQGGPGSVGSTEFMSGGLRVGSQVHGVGFEEFTAGRNGPAYVVMSGAGVAAVSYRENGTGRPCLAAIGLDEARPRFCLDGELSGTQIRSGKVEIPFDVGGDRLVLMFARPEVHDIELVAKTGETMSRSNVVKTKTSNDVRFSAYWHQDDRLEVGEIVGHRSAGEPNEGIAPPSR